MGIVDLGDDEFCVLSYAEGGKNGRNSFIEVESNVADDSVDGGDFEGSLSGNGVSCVAPENGFGYNTCVRVGPVFIQRGKNIVTKLETYVCRFRVAVSDETIRILGGGVGTVSLTVRKVPGIDWICVQVCCN